MRSYVLLLCLLISDGFANAQISVLTGQDDVSRTSANTQEVLLSPLSIGSGNFEALMPLPVNGGVQTQPLYVSGVQINNATTNVLVVTSLLDDVYAFDADSGLELWHITLLDAAHGAGPGAIYDPVIASASIGILGTPVINPGTGTIYLIGKTWENNYPVQRLHALDILTGAEKFGAPTTVQATVSGIGSGSVGGQVSFDSNAENNRAGLLLLNGIVYAAFSAAHEPGLSWHGWVLAYNATTLQQTGVWNTAPNGTGSGIWMAGIALAADVIDPINHPFGRMFIATGNGTYDAVAPFTANQDYGDDLVNLDLTGGIPTPQDSFTPSNQAALNAGDLDLGSGGVVVLPDEVGSAQHPHLLVQASKSGNIFLVDRDNMGGYNSTDAVVEELNSGLAFEGMFGSPAYWNGNLYFWAANDYLKSFSIANGYIFATPTSTSSASAPYSGATPLISANGNSNGVVWALTGAEGTTATLQAFDATNLASLLFSSNTDSLRDNPGLRTKFSVPTEVNGKVYAGANGQVVVFGSMFTVSPSSAAIQSPPGATATTVIRVASPVGSTFSGVVALSIFGLPAGVSARLSAPVITLGQSPASGFSTLTLTITNSVPTGSYPVQVTGTNGNLQSSTNLTLNVATGPYPVFSDSVVSFSSPIGATSAAYTVTLTNSGSADLVISSLSILGANGLDFSMTTSCTTDLPIGASCTVSITFTPRKGNETAMLTIADNAGGMAGSIQTVILIGNGQGASVAITPSIAFGVQPFGAASSGYPITVSNTGTAALAISGMSVGGTNGADFVVTPSTNCGASLPPGLSCSIVVVFTASVPSNESAILTVTDNAGNLMGSTQTVTLTGAGSAPTATLSTTSFTFPAQNEGVKSVLQSVQLINTGTAALLLNSIAISGANAADFSSSGCGASLAAGKSCTIYLAFLPRTIGQESATWTLTDNSGAVPGSTQTIALSGTGLATPAVSMTSALSFGTQTVGLASGPLTATLKNTGTGPLSIASITLAGANAADFSISSSSTCGAAVAAGATCSVALTFTPSVQASENAILTVTDNAGNLTGATQSVSLAGAGGLPVAVVSPTTVTFPAQTDGVKSALQTVTLSNTGNTALLLTGLGISGANASDFSSSGCGTSLAAGKSCSIYMAFLPKTAGAESAVWTLTDNSGGISGSTQMITLSGTGLGAPVVSIPATLAFGMQTVGFPSSPAIVSLKNTGTGALSISSIGITGTNAADFVINPVTTCGASLAVGASCSISITFNPAVRRMKARFLALLTIMPIPPDLYRM